MIVVVLISPPLTYYTTAVEALYRATEADFAIHIVNGDIMGGVHQLQLLARH